MSTSRTLARALAAITAAGVLSLSACQPADPAPVVRTYEDGSYVLTDGTTGCTPGALCDTPTLPEKVTP